MKPATSENRGGQRPIGSELRAAAAPKKSLPMGSHGPGGDVVRPNKCRNARGCARDTCGSSQEAFRREGRRQQSSLQSPSPSGCPFVSV